MLSADDPLPLRPERVLIAGVTGAGKTTLARRIAEKWQLEHHEMDALHHGPDWTPRPSFLDEVKAFAATERWVTEWQYTSKGTDAVVAPRAQVLVWLDYPWRVVRTRLLRRTLSRSILRTRMWNGNVEKPIWRMLGAAPEDSILAWQTATRYKWNERMPMIRQNHPDLTIVRLRHPRETARWLLAQEPAAPGAFTAPPKRRSRER